MTCSDCWCMISIIINAQGKKIVSIKAGDKLYYTGDVCNASGWAMVTEVEVTKWGVVVRAMEIAGQFRTFSPSPSNIATDYSRGHTSGERFVTEAAYRAYRAGREAA